jgi:hypothetical protein
MTQKYRSETPHAIYGFTGVGSGQLRDQLAMTTLTPHFLNPDMSVLQADIRPGVLKNLVSGLHQ